MVNNSESEKSYWPHMILGFLGIGIMLGYWTVSSAINMPVNESNRYQKKYQQADMGINQIIEAQQRFDEKYHIAPVDFKESTFEPNEFLKRSHGKIIALGTQNRLQYRVETRSGDAVNDAIVSFLLTRPHTVADDQKFATLKADNGIYAVAFDLENAGRYTLRLRVQKGDAVGFVEQEAYLEPK
jgi:hypothetical protein